MSCILLFNNNPYQQHVYFTSASKVAAGIYDGAHSVTGYFHLRSTNKDLMRANASLESEVIGLRARIKELELKAESDSLQHDIDTPKPFDFILAPVINNSVTHPHNFITLSKGEVDGIKPEMGVVDQNGVVGVVNITGPHYSRVISLLNPDFRLSCKIKSSDVIGSLVWDGRNAGEALLEELPRHTVYQSGDTIVTSGYSAVFPEGLPVGTVLESVRDNEDDNFFTLRVKLFTDFSKLSTVRVVVSKEHEEIKSIESGK